MNTFRYDTSGAWYKGNTHIHTTLSDGDLSPAEALAMYERAGYDFLFRTDHRVAAREPESAPPGRCFWINGIELDGLDAEGGDYHVVCLGTFNDLDPAAGLPANIESVLRQDGLIILAHPHWTGNTFDEAFRFPFHGVEVYNHVCWWCNGKSDGLPFWDTMLLRRPNTFAFAADDMHLNRSIGDDAWNGGWIMVNAAARTPAAILAAIKKGNFYASCGPSFHRIDGRDHRVEIDTSPICAARLIGPRGEGLRQGSVNGPAITHAAFDIPSTWPYARLEIEDETGRRAWSNPLLVTI
jgi:hypothetical protein